MRDADHAFGRATFAARRAAARKHDGRSRPVAQLGNLGNSEAGRSAVLPDDQRGRLQAALIAEAVAAEVDDVRRRGVRGKLADVSDRNCYAVLACDPLRLALHERQRRGVTVRFGSRDE